MNGKQEMGKKRLRVNHGAFDMDGRLSVLMRNLPGMAYRMINDGQWRIEYVSQGCKKLFGEGPYELILSGRAVFANLVHGARYDKIIGDMELAMSEQRPYKLIYRVNSLTEKEKWVWDQGEGVFSEDGRLIAAVGFVTDFTEHKEMEHTLRGEILRLKESVKKKSEFPGIIGDSPALGKTFSLIEQSANTDANIIVTGESGTGKELVSRAIHDKSSRKKKPFVPVNCGAIPENLLETEFFGCCKGAFSGAFTSRDGILDRAHGGTLFLDEVGEINLNMQTKLLRAIDGGGYTAVGGTKLKTPDIRIIAATNRNLEDLVEGKKMREDFYFRINVISVRVPPLRERIQDLPLLIAHFLGAGSELLVSNKQQMALMEAYHWPGNIRELQNVLNRYMVNGKLDLPGISCLAKEKTGTRGCLRTLVKAYEKKQIRQALKQNNLNRTKTASFLGIDRRSLYSKIKEYNLGQ